MVNDATEEKPDEQRGDSAPEIETEATPSAEASDAEGADESNQESAVQPTAPETAEAAEQEPAAGLALGGVTPAEADVQADEPTPVPLIRGKVDRFGVAIGTGRRKTAVARVRVKEGEGKLSINGRSLDEYFHIERYRADVEAPLRAADMQGKVDVWVRVNGGGPTGQAGAIVLGIARALQAMKPELHHALSDGGYLTRDGRMVERKKYGYKKARKSFQFSKR